MRIHPALRFSLAAALALALTSAPSHAQSVQATYAVDGRDPTAERVLEELKRHIENGGVRVLAPGHKLSVALVSVHLAGQRSGTLGHHGVRVYSDGTPARVDLSFNLRDAADAVVSQGNRTLRSRANFVSDRGSDPLRFEKELLDEWLAKEFGPRK